MQATGPKPTVGVSRWVDCMCISHFRFFEVLSLFEFLYYLYNKAECRQEIKLKQDNR